MTDILISYTLEYTLKLITQHTAVSTQTLVITHTRYYAAEYNDNY